MPFAAHIRWSCGNSFTPGGQTNCRTVSTGERCRQWKPPWLAVPRAASMPTGCATARSTSSLIASAGWDSDSAASHSAMNASTSNIEVLSRSSRRPERTIGAQFDSAVQTGPARTSVRSEPGLEEAPQRKAPGGLACTRLASALLVVPVTAVLELHLPCRVVSVLLVDEERAVVLERAAGPFVLTRRGRRRVPHVGELVEPVAEAVTVLVGQRHPELVLHVAELLGVHGAAVGDVLVDPHVALAVDRQVVGELQAFDLFTGCTGCRVVERGEQR